MAGAHMQAMSRDALLPKRAVVVTGASTGIGYGICAVLLQKGFRVFGSVRSQKDAERLQAELGAEAFTPLVFDVTNEAAVKAAAAQVRTLLDTALPLCFLSRCLPDSDYAGTITTLFESRLTLVSNLIFLFNAQVREALAGSTLFGLVNNAGVSVHGPALLQPISEVR